MVRKFVELLPEQMADALQFRKGNAFRAAMLACQPCASLDYSRLFRKAGHENRMAHLVAAYLAFRYKEQPKHTGGA